MVLLLHATNMALAKIQIGLHTMSACIAMSALGVLISLSLRSMFETIAPFETLFVGLIAMLMSDVLYSMIKFIPVKNKRTGQTKRWAIGA